MDVVGDFSAHVQLISVRVIDLVSWGTIWAPSSQVCFLYSPVFAPAVCGIPHCSNATDAC